MLDLQLLRGDLKAVSARLAERGYTLDEAGFDALEKERKTIQGETQDLQARRNQLSKQIGMMKGKGEDASDLMAQVNAQADQLKALEGKLADVQTRLAGPLTEVSMVIARFLRSAAAALRHPLSASWIA